jgi:hypothetical protein
MKRILLCGLVSALLGACTHDPRELNDANLTRALNDYLNKRGDLCLAKNNWPIDVSEQERLAGSRNALQMPVLEHLGLVAGVDTTTGQASEDGAKPATIQVRRYRLTSEGTKYYLARPAHRNPTGNRYAEAPHDLCAVRLSVDRLVGWEVPAEGEAVVTYTYKVKPAPWTASREARDVFPMVDRVISGAGTMELREVFVLGASGWEAKDL